MKGEFLMKENLSSSFVNVGCLYAHVSVVSKDVISTFFDITWYTEGVIYAKNPLLYHFIFS